jgi:hypothetical protein
MKPAGYSGAPLARKLGLKEGSKIRLVDAPAHYRSLFEEWPRGIALVEDAAVAKDFIHCFVTDAARLLEALPALKKEMAPAASLWVSWPKKAARIATDVSENVIRKAALANGLVDVKVCAIDETWSALKLVIPVKDRRG